MDKHLIQQRFARAVDTYDAHATAQRHIAKQLFARLETVAPPNVGPALEVGCGTGMFTRLWLPRLRTDGVVLNDICPEVEPYLADLKGGDVRFVPGDAERIPLPGGRGLIAACAVVQWFDAPAGFLLRCADLLRPSGLLAVSLFGPDNLREVAALTGQRLDYPTMENVCRTLAARYTVRHAGEERIRLSFDTPHDVLRHLRQTGVTGTGRTTWTRSRLADFDARYRAAYTAPDGGVGLTYHPIYIIAEKNEKE